MSNAAHNQIDFDEEFAVPRSVHGVVGNLETIPAGQTVTLPENCQAVVYGTLTVNGIYRVNGTLHAGYDWPA